MTSQNTRLRFTPSIIPKLDLALEKIAGAVEQAGSQEGWDPGLVFRVNLVLEELVTNIMSHGREENMPTPDIDIDITPGKEQLTIVVSDNGKPFNLLTDAPAPPPVTMEGQDVPVGGLGIHLVKNMMNEISYQHSGGKNQVTMTTRRK